jgi:CBS domain-containing protein
MTIAAILKGKGHSVTSVGPDTPVSEVVHTLAEAKIGAVLVLDRAAAVLGILSERDVVRGLARNGAAVLDMAASQLMTSRVTSAHSGNSVAHAMQVMTDGRFRHLPIIDDGMLVGLVSIGDIVKARLSQQEQEVDSLKAYVAGGV